jgi:hypothetical protein
MRALPVVAVVVASFLISACPMSSRPDDPSGAEVAGVYDARLPAADASGRIVTLWLERAGAATLETVYVGKGQAPVERGRWSVRAEEVTVRLLEADDGPRSEMLVFTLKEERLVPKTWDRSRWGEMGLSLTRRHR